MQVFNNANLRSRRIDFFNSVCDEAEGYNKAQKDTFAVIYPKEYEEGTSYPLCVVFHSAGHDVYSTISTLFYPGNHDVYHVPENMFGLFLDCREHSFEEGNTDWFWGGRHAQEPEKNERSGVELQPVEKRVFATIDWTVNEFNIDTNRIYGVGNSMGGTGALGHGLAHGDLFAALKVNVAAGVYHALDRSGLTGDAPEGFKIPDPPIILDYSAQNDEWSTGHENLYKAARENGFALMGFWGPFGHENNHSKINEYIDIVHAFDIFSVKKNEAYPAFTSASCDDKNPWENDKSSTESGQVNAYFRWKVICDTENEFAIELRLLRQNEYESRLTFPTEATADVTIRRLQNFNISDGEKLKYVYGDKKGETTVCGAPKFEALTVTTNPTVLKITK